MKSLLSISVMALCLSACALPIEREEAFFSQPKASTGGGGGGSGFSIVGVPTSQQGTTGDTTPAPINTAGATDYFVIVTGASGSTPTVTSALGNTFTADVAWGPNNRYMLFHSVPTSTGFDSVTVSTVSGCSVCFFAVARAGGGHATLDGVSTPGITANWGSTGTLRAGSLTPSTPNDISIAFGYFDVGAGGVGDTCDSGYTKIAAVGTNPGLCAYYKLKSADSTAENPGATHNGASDGYFLQAMYK